jgi:hypothetical protein
LCFNATFNNISALSWRTVLVVEEAGVPGEKHVVDECGNGEKSRNKVICLN